MHEDSILRLGVFFGMLVTMTCLETLQPRRKLTQNRANRWWTNLAMAAIDSFALRLLSAISLVSMSEFAQSQGWGVLNVIAMPFIIELILALLLLDFFIYLQHWLTHNVPVLWRLHRVHHTDRDLDASSAVRFHPLEIILSLIYKVGVVCLVGPSALAVLAFEIIVNASALFNHANVRIPRRLDKVLRSLIITPDVHRVHHSVDSRETNSNYGNFLSIWDRLCLTYVAEPREGHKDMKLGLEQWQSSAPSKLSWSLLLPFKK